MADKRRLEGKVALVTGGARGIGAAIVKRLSDEGAKVYFTVRESVKQAKELICDVRQKDQVERAVEKILEEVDGIDILVNNAGVIRDGLFLTMSDEDWDEVVRTNLGGTYNFCKAVLPSMMVRRYGRIVNISSVVGELGGFGQANYAASKGAVNSMTKALAAEFASRSITVNAVAPGMVNTDMTTAVRSLFGDKIQERIPLGSFAEPEDIASIVSFLVSDEARYITGQIVTVDGGLSLLSRH